jgi:hypothetical protein
MINDQRRTVMAKALSAINSGQLFEAHFELMGFDTQSRHPIACDQPLTSQLNQALNAIFAQHTESLGMGFMILGLVPFVLNVLNESTTDSLKRRLLSTDLNAEDARQFVDAVNLIIADHENFSARKTTRPPVLTHLCCLALSEQERHPHLAVDVKGFGQVLGNKGDKDFLSGISSIVLPVITMIDSGKADQALQSLFSRKLIDPLYRLCSELATYYGMMSRTHFIENLEWFAIKRLQNLSPGAQTVSLCNPQRVAQLVCRLLCHSAASFSKHLGADSTSSSFEKRLQSCRVVLDYVREHLTSDERREGFNHLFSGLIAKYGHILYYGSHAAYPAYLVVLHSLYVDVDLDFCQKLLKRRDGVYLAMYIKDFNPEKMGSLSDNNLTDLLGHDLGL